MQVTIVAAYYLIIASCLQVFHSYFLEDCVKLGYAGRLKLGSLDVEGHHIWFRLVVHLNIHFWSEVALAALSVVLESFTNRCVEFVN